MKKLRDAVHGDIFLTGQELAVLDTPQLQRLRGIRQLGAAYLVYPSAHHTRFEHCLGTCWMAKRIVSAVQQAGGQVPDAEARQAIFLAALAHDATHVPFGHTFEDERRLLERHDASHSRYELIFGDTELGRLLRSSEAGRLALRLLEPGPGLPAELRLLHDVVAGTVGADLLDYLKRDNYFCGLRYEFDERLFSYFREHHGRLALDLGHGGLLRRDALSEVTNLLRIRYVLSERVYYHHAKIAAGVMISRAVERALQAGLTEADMCRLTDESLLHHLVSAFPGEQTLAQLVEAFRNRRLYKRCYMLSREVGERKVAELVRLYHNNETNARDHAERAVAECLRVPPHKVALYCAPEGMALKEAEVPVLVPDGRCTRLADLNSEEVQLLKRQHRQLWRLYVFIAPDLADRAAEAGRACEEVIGLPNELPAETGGGRL